MSMTSHDSPSVTVTRSPVSDLITIEGDSLAAIWQEYVSYVMEGERGHDADVLIRERFFVTLRFPPATNFDDFHPLMDTSIHPVYMHKMFSTSKSRLGDSYGFRIHRSYGVDQFDLLCQRILEKPESKAIFVNLLHPLQSSVEQEGGMAMEKTACLAHLQVIIRDGKLHIDSTFRSQNAWKSHGNFIAINAWRRKLHAELGQRFGLMFSEGDVVVRVAAAHVYEHDWEMAEQLTSKGAPL